LVNAGKKIILVADHSKFDKIAVSKFCNLSDIDMLITDNQISHSMAESIRENGIEIKCV
jgi:DeoR/GlpR family transcriptional regulator of sugar metabolism